MNTKELREIAESQKSITTKRLMPYINFMDKLEKQFKKRIQDQTSTIDRLNKMYQREKTQADRRKQVIIDYENLKTNHRNLKNEFKILQERMRKAGVK